MRYAILMLTIVYLFLTGSVRLFSQEHENIELVSQISGSNWNCAEALAIDGEFAYIADADSGIRIVDISNPISPVEIAFFSYTPIVYAVDVSDGFVYLASEEGLVIIDVTDEWDPQLENIFRDIGEARGVEVSDNICYIAQGRDGIGILNISNPENVRILSELDTPGYSINVTKGEDHIYVADRNGGLRIIDVRNPEEPVEVGSLAPEGETRDVVLAGNSVYLAETEAVSRVRITNPENPLRDRHLNINHPAMTITGNDEFVYAGVTSTGLLVISIHGTYELVGQYSGGSPVGLILRDSTVFAVYRSDQLKVINVNDPDDLFEIGQCGKPTHYSAISVVGQIAYLSTYPIGIMAYDISNPGEPDLLWRDRFYQHRRTGKDLTVQDGYLYSIELRGMYGWLRIAKLDNPEDSLWISELRINDPGRMNLTRGTLYITARDGSATTIYDISDRYSPNQTGRIVVPGGGDHNDIFVDDYLAYIATEDLDLIVKNIADPLNARNIGSYESEFEINGITIQRHRAFLACRNGLDVVDISDPREIVRIGFCEIPSSPREIEIVENTAFIACGSGGLYAIDISDFENPDVIGFYDTPGNTRDVSVSGTYAVVADDDNFAIYDCSAFLEIPDFRDYQPSNFTIYPAYPNPFNSTTTITYELPHPGIVSLQLYNPFGQRISTLFEGNRQAGIYSAILAGKNLASGLYFVRLDGAGQMFTRKVMLVR